MSESAQPPQQLIVCLPAWLHAVTLELVTSSGNPLYQGDELQQPVSRNPFCFQLQSGQNIKIFTPNGLILKEYKFIYLFPATNVSSIIHRLQILTLNHGHVSFVVPGTKPLHTKREILVRGIFAWGSPSDKLFLQSYRNINLRDIIFLD